MLVQALQQIQDQFGYLPRTELEFLAGRAAVPLYRVQEVTSFFPHFRREPPPPVTVHVCQSMTCHLGGAADLLARTREVAAPADRGETARRRGRLVPGPLRPGPGGPHGTARPGERAGTTPTTAAWAGARTWWPSSPRPSKGSPCRRTRPRITAEVPPPWQIDVYDRRHGAEPPAAVRRRQHGSSAANDPKFVVEALEVAGLVGMGGAAARTWKKWQDVRDAARRRKYIVCNADESEPGTFKDRELLLRTPHLLVEGMLLAGLTLGANARLHLHPPRVPRADRAPAAGRLSRRPRRDRARGAGTVPAGGLRQPRRLYICGEESALHRGHRGQPGPAPQPAARHPQQRPVRPPDPGQQRRDLRLGARYRCCASRRTGTRTSRVRLLLASAAT